MGSPIAAIARVIDGVADFAQRHYGMSLLT